MANNIFKEPIEAEKPALLESQQITVYVPNASNDTAGKASFDGKFFRVSPEGKVDLKTDNIVDKLGLVGKEELQREVNRLNQIIASLDVKDVNAAEYIITEEADKIRLSTDGKTEVASLIFEDDGEDFNKEFGEELSVISRDEMLKRKAVNVDDANTKIVQTDVGIVTGAQEKLCVLKLDPNGNYVLSPLKLNSNELVMTDETGALTTITLANGLLLKDDTGIHSLINESDEDRYIKVTSDNVVTFENIDTNVVRIGNDRYTLAIDNDSLIFTKEVKPLIGGDSQ